MMSDPNFDTDLKNAVTAEERKRLKADLQSLEASLQTKTPKKQKTNWLLVASVTLLVSLGTYFAIFNQNVAPKKLYAQHFEPYRNIVAPIVRGNENTDTKTIAFTYYEQKNYEKALTVFNELASQNSVDANTLSFYKANAFLELNQPKKAIELLVPLAEDTSHKWQDESLWYLALASLQIEDTDNVKKYLTQLQNTSNFKAKEVKKILKNLD